MQKEKLFNCGVNFCLSLTNFQIFFKVQTRNYRCRHGIDYIFRHLSEVLATARLKVLQFEVSENLVQISLRNNEYIHDGKFFFSFACISTMGGAVKEAAIN